MEIKSGTLTKKNYTDAGWDIHATEPCVITVGGRALISTDLHVKIDEGYFGMIKPRSGLAWKYGIDVLAGVIDSDYTGEVKVLLINLGMEDFAINPGDRIAQLIITPCNLDTFIKVDELTETVRSENGFGSTGI